VSVKTVVRKQTRGTSSTYLEGKGGECVVGVERDDVNGLVLTSNRLEE
jgi:hypothetical protein